MGSELRFDGRVASITGAGNGLGRAHALLLGSRGASVVVNDLGGSAHGGGKSSAAADAVVAEIRAAGGTAIASYDSVEDGDKIVKTALDAWGRVDILVNNAGILRDTSFQKMTQEDWDLVYRVHVLGAFRVTHAAWGPMRDAGYGRILFTASAAGIYGNFGQANYAMAKLGLVGFSNTLALEGRKRNILVNTIAPIAGSRMTETVLPKELLDALDPALVSPLVACLCHESSEETGGLYEVGGGFAAKLRFSRAAGKTFRLGRAVTPEMLRDAWGAVTSFDEATAPADVTQSMAPILANVQAGKSKGGNAFIDVDAALGHVFPPSTSRYEPRDLALYALAVGAGADPLDSSDLQMVYELHPDGFRPLPTFGVIPALNAIVKMAAEGKQAPGLHYGFDRVLHGEQYFEVKGPLAPQGTLTHKARIKDIFDKGKNALVVTETRSFDEHGAEVFYNETTTVVRGAGGWGGDRGPSVETAPRPERAPDAVVTERIPASQALLYRLNGDWNPLHVDPAFAKGFGFDRPILHGLCTFGFAARHVIKSFCKNDPRYFKSIKVRFAESVFPGETLKTEMWREGEGRVLFQCTVVERGKVVISSAAVELSKELPASKAAPPAATAATRAGAPEAARAAGAATAAAATAGGGAVTSRDIFAAVGHHIATHPDVVAKVGTVFQLHLRGPESHWVIDAKNGGGSVTEGTAEKADVTLELSDDDWVGIASGQADAQKLFFGGKLKISGNMMAAQKLEFLKKVDREGAKGAIAKGPSQAGGEGAGPARGPSAAAAAKAPAVFAALAERAAASPALGAEVGAVLQFHVRAPASSWVVDLRPGKVSVRPGAEKDAATVLSLDEEDLLALCSGTATAAGLFQRGKLRVDGDVRLAHRLSFLKGLGA